MQGKKTYFFYWRECDVAIRGVKPSFCEPRRTTFTAIPEMQFSFKESLNLFKNGSADLIGKPVMYQQMIFNINKITNILSWLNKKVQNLYGKLFLALCLFQFYLYLRCIFLKYLHSNSFIGKVNAKGNIFCNY